MKFFNKLIYTLFVIFSVKSFSAEIPSIFYKQNNCKLVDAQQSVVRDYNGDLCVFLNDGRYLVYQAGDNTLKFYSKNDLEIWEKPTEAIRSMHPSKDQKTVLLLGHRLEKNIFCNAKVDFIRKINLKTGNSIASLVADDAVKMLIRGQRSAHLLFPLKNKAETEAGYNCRLSGFQSIEESASHFILYAEPHYKMNYILSNDFTEVLWSWPIDQEFENVFKIIVFKKNVYVFSRFHNNSGIKIQSVSFADQKLNWSKVIPVEKSIQLTNEALEVTDKGISLIGKTDKNTFVKMQFDMFGVLLTQSDIREEQFLKTSENIFLFLKNNKSKK